MIGREVSTVLNGKNVVGIFHGFFVVNLKIRAVVELKNGNVRIIDAIDIKFINEKADEYENTTD